VTYDHRTYDAQPTELRKVLALVALFTLIGQVRGRRGSGEPSRRPSREPRRYTPRSSGPCGIELAVPASLGPARQLCPMSSSTAFFTSVASTNETGC
jgi:hypothetical protein